MTIFTPTTQPVEQHAGRQIVKPLSQHMSDREWIEDIVQMEIDHRIYLYQKSRTIDMTIIFLVVVFFCLPELNVFLG